VLILTCHDRLRRDDSEEPSSCPLPSEWERVRIRPSVSSGLSA
jgi:hypothetical protein